MEIAILKSVSLSSSVVVVVVVVVVVSHWDNTVVKSKKVSQKVYDTSLWSNLLPVYHCYCYFTIGEIPLGQHSCKK